MRRTIIVTVVILLLGSVAVANLDQAKRGFRSTFVYSGWNWIGRHSIDTDPNFNLDDHFDSLKQDIPGQYWRRFQGVRSLNEANRVHSEIMLELDDQDIVNHSQSAGYAAYLLGQLPAYLFALTLLIISLRVSVRTLFSKATKA